MYMYKPGGGGGEYTQCTGTTPPPSTRKGLERLQDLISFIPPAVVA